jgi:RNA polymerase sigma-70 factor (ECF subfamily)
VTEQSGSDSQLERWLDRLRGGDPAAREALINYSCERLRRMTRKLLRDFEGVHRWEQTDDVLQRALLRLYKSLADVQPENVGGFMGLAATQIRRELLDLARKYGGPEGMGRHHATDAVPGMKDTDLPARHERPADTAGPVTLQLWTEFHEHIEKLPDDERQVVELILYQQLPQAEVAKLVGVAVRTVKRRFRDAKIHLHDALGAAVADML